LTHTVNRGVSFSRQQGLEVATGEFVIHCDSDDWVEREMYNVMYETAVREDADVVCCGFTVDYSDGKVQSVRYTNVGEMKEVSFNIAPLTGSVWNKLVRRSMLVDAGVSFPQNINWGEDFCVAISSLLLSNKTVCVEESLYHYCMNGASITHTLSSKKVEELIEVAAYVEGFLNAHNLLQDYEFQLNYLKFQLKAPFLMFSEIRNITRWNSLFPESNSQIFHYPFPLYLRIAAKLIVMGLSKCAQLVLVIKDIYQKKKK
jgi:glycosyltransferase involved in cell wall biosynthesis